MGTPVRSRLIGRQSDTQFAWIWVRNPKRIDSAFQLSRHELTTVSEFVSHSAGQRLVFLEETLRISSSIIARP
jgi:hypothetical protein